MKRIARALLPLAILLALIAGGFWLANNNRAASAVAATPSPAFTRVMLIYELGLG